MTNDDKDLKLKECPFCGKSAHLHSYAPVPGTLGWYPVKYGDGTGKCYQVFCNDSDCQCGHGQLDVVGYYTEQVAIERWNTRTTPQQPSEPLKELDEKEGSSIYITESTEGEWSGDRTTGKQGKVLWLNFKGNGGNYAMINLNNLASKEGAVISKAMYQAIAKFGQPSEKKAVSVTDIENIILSHNLNGNDVLRRLAQAIHSALPAQREVRYPEKSEHSQQCLYVIEPRYFGNSSKEKFCDCGAFERNLTIDEFKKLNGDKT